VGNFDEQPWGASASGVTFARRLNFAACSSISSTTWRGHKMRSAPLFAAFTSTVRWPRREQYVNGH
jgi:hypothetical protein